MATRPATHPGEIVLEDFLNAHEPPIMPAAAAKRLELPLEELQEILEGRRGVTDAIAVKRAAFTGTSAEFWIALQRNRDQWLAGTP